MDNSSKTILQLLLGVTYSLFGLADIFAFYTNPKPEMLEKFGHFL